MPNAVSMLGAGSFSPSVQELAFPSCQKQTLELLLAMLFRKSLLRSNSRKYRQCGYLHCITSLSFDLTGEQYDKIRVEGGQDLAFPLRAYIM